MASRVKAKTWMRGRVKGVVSGDTLVIMRITSTPFEIAPEKTITLSSLMAPRLARQDRPDEPFAWQSREFLRDLCIGKEVVFQVDYVSKGREFGTVCLDGQFVAYLVVAEGWAKVWEVREQERYKGEFSPHLNVLLQYQEQAKRKCVGRWNKAPGASRHAVRNLPPSAIGDPKNLDTKALLVKYKGKSLEAFVEYVRDGSTIRVYLLPGYQFVQVFVAGIQAPSMGKRIVEPEKASSEENKKTSNGSAQKIPVSSASVTRSAPDPFGKESKHFTEIHILHRYVSIVLEGFDEYSNLIGSVYYEEGEQPKDLAEQLLKNGLAKFVKWSASMLPDDDKKMLKSLELEAKRSRLRMWTSYIHPPSNFIAIQDQNFTGKIWEKEVSNGRAIKKREKEEIQVVVTEVLSGGKFYVQATGTQEVASIQQELASLKLQEAHVIDGSFNPKKGDLVLARFSRDNSWYRAMIVNSPGGAIGSSEDKFEVFYIDYGNQEMVEYSQLRPLDSSISSSPGLAQLCSLAYVTVPRVEEDYGKEAALSLKYWGRSSKP
ncbi:ribonuclease TUDOR 2 [Daucus carota subsp. sativus]|uniref:ribonuclease TUDOR 2 n=1 Tax=Daucus carota subsp. sativus TaxID=79200 RepID=UPI0007F01F23|nr:PREDICTED: staphylococcal nuclease domain-containing protein 1-like [Daucus carota subsp. sativus]